MNKNKVLFFGPYPEPMTGQSISFKEAFQGYSGHKILFNTTKYGVNKLLNSLYCFLIIPFVFLFNKFDVVYFTCIRSNFGSIKDIELLLLCKLFNKKIVNHLHGADLILFFKDAGFLRPLLKYCYEQIDVSIVLLPSMSEQFKGFPEMKIEVIKNCYSREFENIDVLLDNKKEQVLYLSNIIYSKGIFDFLEASMTLLKQNPTVVIKIAGLPMGDFYKTEQEVKELFDINFNTIKAKFPDRIFYLGTVSGKDKIKLLSESSVFVLPTFYKTEAFPITIIEAMRFGNAIVTTKHNYLEDVVTIENGILVTINSSDELVIAINQLFSNKALLFEIQKHNISESLINYSPSNYNSSLNTVLNSLAL